MFKSLFFRRLYVPYVLIICAVALTVGVLGASRLRQAHLQQARVLLRDTSLAITHILGRDLETGDSAAIQKEVQELSSGLDLRITIIGPEENGVVWAESDTRPVSMGPHRFRPEIVMARTNGEGWDYRVSDTLHRSMLYYAMRVPMHGGLGYVRLASRVDELDENLRGFYVTIAAVTVFCVLLAAFLAYHVARRQAIPIVEVTRFAEAVAKGHLEHRILRSDQGELGVLARSLNSMADSFSHLLASTEKDKAELRAILTSMSEGVIAADSQRRVLLVNDAAARLLGFSREAAEGKLLWEVIRNEQIIKGAEASAVEQRRQFVITSGTTHLEITLCPFQQATRPPRPPGLIVVVRDVTQALRYQELRKEFVANVSHELRTPLSVIKGYIETLRDGAINDKSKCDDYLATIERHSNQLTNLVADLLELSRLESAAGVPRRVAVDLPSLVRRVADLLAPAVAAKQHCLTLDIPPASPTIPGNADYLERAVINLLENAIKYTPAGGQITIAIREESPNAVIEVRDNGIGIPAEDLPRIFERFYRVDRSRSREMGGTGLGLAIVKHIVQAHGGNVDVKSEPGCGATFRLLLPLAHA